MSYANIDGLRLHYELQGEGRTLVMLHGLQGDASDFIGIVRGLRDSYRILTFDQRGSGHSDKPGGEYSTALLADDTAALLEYLSIPKAHVWGVSMGGQLAQQLALRHPQRVDRLILGCTTPGGKESRPADHELMAASYSIDNLSARERTLRQAKTGFTAQWLAEHPEVIDSMISRRKERPIDSTALESRRKAFYAHDCHADVPRIAAPTLVLTGDQDSVIPMENSRLLSELIPRARLEILRPAGHKFWIEQEQRVLPIVEAFLSGY